MNQQSKVVTKAAVRNHFAFFAKIASGGERIGQICTEICLAQPRLLYQCGSRGHHLPLLSACDIATSWETNRIRHVSPG